MRIKVDLTSRPEATSWNNYVAGSDKSNVYHLSQWAQIIHSAYGHAPLYLIAKSIDDNLSPSATDDGTHPPEEDQKIVGILPLFHMKSFLFGSNMYSVPFFDMGGILADSGQVEEALIRKAIEIGRSRKVKNIELRQQEVKGDLRYPSGVAVEMNTRKVRMVLPLPRSSEELLKRFKAKLRSQIKRPLKDGLYARIGAEDLLKDFYKVFAENMRDLGSPVHSVKIIANVLLAFKDKAKIVVVYKEHEPLACSLVVGHNTTLANPWASSLRKYGRLSPNMLLYWNMLAYACDNGYQNFDFGRSTPGEGTYRFKKQWGARPHPLCWVALGLNSRRRNTSSPDKSSFNLATRLWQRLPIAVSRRIGPLIRKHISL